MREVPKLNTAHEELVALLEDIKDVGVLKGVLIIQTEEGGVMTAGTYADGDGLLGMLEIAKFQILCDRSSNG